MALKMVQRNEDEVPSPNAAGKVDPDFIALKAEMSRLPAGMVLEIVADNERAVRSTKMLVSKAAKQLGSPWRHWNVGPTVFAKPADAPRRRGRRPKSE
jgi:hypothetical protein